MNETETTEQASPTTERRGFSSRWILDRERRTGTATPPPSTVTAPLAAGADADGDGYPDPAGVRLVEPRPASQGTLRALGRWVGRSIVSIVVVASLVAAAVAATELLHARDDRDAAEAALAGVERARDDAQARVGELEAELQDARDEVAAAERAVADAEADRDGVELENRALRNMLLDSNPDRASGAR